MRRCTVLGSSARRTRGFTGVEVSPSELFAGTAGFGLFSSSDGGAWVGRNAGLAGLPVDWVAADPHVPARIYATTIGFVSGGRARGWIFRRDGSGDWAEI